MNGEKTLGKMEQAHPSAALHLGEKRTPLSTFQKGIRFASRFAKRPSTGKWSMNKTILRVGRSCCAFLFIFLSVSAHATEQSVIPAVFLSVPPIIDGELDDSCWGETPSVDDFCETSKGIPAGEPTTAWIAYDGRNVYVAFKCVDSRPETIHRQQRKRGGDIWGDDFVGVDFDSYKDGQISWFDVTARGTQTEKIAGGTGTKIEWIGDWQGAAKLQPDGWTAEMAIPFSMLKYHSNQTVMGIALVRRHPRSGEMWVCPNVGPMFNVSLFHDWTGLRLPRIRPRPFIMGYTLAEKTKEEQDLTAGLDVKCRFTSSLIGVATAYPDFRNVEQQVESIDFSYAKIWYPDRRPFFQEGRGYIAADSLFYSRNIREIDGGAKFFGKAGDFRLGILDVLDVEEVNHLVSKFGQSFADRGGWDVDFVSRANTAEDNHAVRLSGWFARRRKERSYDCSFGLAKSYTDGTGGDGSIKTIRFSTTGGPRTISASAEYKDVGEEYNAVDGFVSELDKVGGWANIEYHDEFEKGLIQGWNISLSGNKYEHHDGSLFYRGFSIKAGTWTRQATGCNLGFSASDRMNRQEELNRDRICSLRIFWLGSDLYRSGGLSLNSGRKAGGNYVYTNLSQGFDITDDWTFRLNVEYMSLSSQPDLPHWQVVFSANYTITEERGLGARIVARGGNRNVNLMFRQAVRRGMDVFFIYGEPNAEETQHRFALKILFPLYR